MTNLKDSVEKKLEEIQEHGFASVLHAFLAENTTIQSREDSLVLETLRGEWNISLQDYKAFETAIKAVLCLKNIQPLNLPQIRSSAFTTVLNVFASTPFTDSPLVRQTIDALMHRWGISAATRRGYEMQIVARIVGVCQDQAPKTTEREDPKAPAPVTSTYQEQAEKTTQAGGAASCQDQAPKTTQQEQGAKTTERKDPEAPAPVTSTYWEQAGGAASCHEQAAKATERAERTTRKRTQRDQSSHWNQKRFQGPDYKRQFESQSNLTSHQNNCHRNFPETPAMITRRQSALNLVADLPQIPRRPRTPRVEIDGDEDGEEEEADGDGNET